MRPRMTMYESLTHAQREVAHAMADAARDVLREHGYLPPMDDRAAEFDEACALFLGESRAQRGGTPPQGGRASPSSVTRDT